MHFPTTTFLTAALAVGSVSATPNPLSRRQGGWWDRDQCHATVGGTVIGEGTMQMLRNTWSNHFAGDLGGSLKVCSYHSVQTCIADTKHRLTKLKVFAVGASVSGSCAWEITENGTETSGRRHSKGFRIWLVSSRRVCVVHVSPKMIIWS